MDNQKINQRTDTIWTPYLAVAYAEGFCEGEGASFEQQIEAWAFLIANKTTLAGLQGWFGRTANSIIESKLINENGIINWDNVENIKHSA